MNFSFGKKVNGCFKIASMPSVGLRVLLNIKEDIDHGFGHMT